MNAHPMAQHYTPDEAAETLDGVSPETYARLWNLLGEMESTKPLGGDGSDGTVEWPEPTEPDHSLLAIWSTLTEAEQAEINDALAKAYSDLEG